MEETILDKAIRDNFITKWGKYFGNAELPITFSAPLAKFLSMIENMDESFLITKSWKQIQQRLA